MPQTLTCPNCNAPLQYDGHSTTMHCAYCQTLVIVPAEIRKPDFDVVEGLSPNDIREIWLEIQDLARTKQRMKAIARLHEIFNVDLGTAKFVVDQMAQGLTPSSTNYGLRRSYRTQVMDIQTRENILSLLESGQKLEAIRVYRQVMDVSLKQASQAVEAMELGLEIPPKETRISAQPSPANTVTRAGATGARMGCFGGWLVIFIILVTAIPVLIALTFTGGPLYEPWSRVNPFGKTQLQLSFGGEGSGAGLFQDARYVASDNNGHIFVGEYNGARIQIFDMQGKFVGQWKPSIEIDDNFYLRGMAVDRDGVMYLSAQGQIYQFIALTGELIGILQPPSDDTLFDDVTLGQDGLLYAVDSRSGDHILRYNRQGQVTLNLRNAVSTVSGKTETTIRLAVDGLGTIYALSLSTEHIYVFSPKGRYITQFGGEGEDPGQFTSSYAISIDNQSRIYASDHGGVMVFASDGRYVDKLKIPAYVNGMCFNDQNWLFTVSNDQMVRVWEIK